MSLRIIKAGILDTVQDAGRYGFQHLGINPNGPMDPYAAQLANALLGKNVQDAVIELHFPAAQIFFETATIICITGADFSPTINDFGIPLNHPIVIAPNSVLKFTKCIHGTRCYVSMLHSLQIEKWLNSYSTNLKVQAGGLEGRALKNEDVLPFSNQINVASLLKGNTFHLLPWQANMGKENTNELYFIYGSEWHWMTEEAQENFQQAYFQITNEADRMGYRLKGPVLALRKHESMVSSAVGFGTVQLLPNGQLIILMADHQTTGGYPRIAHVISSGLSVLAQKHPNNNVKFALTDLATAEKKFTEGQKMLQQLQIACKFKIENLLHVTL